MGRLSAQHRPDQSKMSQSPSRDLSDLIEQAWKKYRVLSQAPPQLKPLSDAVLSLVGVLRLTLDVVQDCQLSATDQWVINTQNEACRQVFEQLDVWIRCRRPCLSSCCFKINMLQSLSLSVIWMLWTLSTVPQLLWMMAINFRHRNSNSARRATTGFSHILWAFSKLSLISFKGERTSAGHVMSLNFSGRTRR